MAVAGYDDSVEAEVENVSAVDAKTLKIEFNKGLNVTEDDFKVKKGSVTSNVSEVNISKDMESAEIELNSKLTEGEYTVTVERKGEDDLTGSVKVDSEKVSGIEVLSDKAPIINGNDDKPDKAKVAYQVTNQYGEDVTETYGTGLDAKVSGTSVENGDDATIKKDGTLEFDLNTNKAETGDIVNVTLIDKDTGVSASETMELTDEAVADETTFGELYNKDDKTLDEDTNLGKNKFYLPMTVKDQYGEEVTDADKANEDLIISNTNPGIAKFDISGAANNNDAVIKEVKIDGEDMLALQVDEVELDGTTDVLAISKNTGDSNKGSVTVEKGVKVDSISLGTPSDIVTANKDILFPLTLTDTDGNEITKKKDYDDLADKDEISLSDHAKVVEKKDKGLFVEYDGSEVTEDNPVTMVITTQSGQSATKSVTPKAEAEAKVVTGLKDDVATGIRKGKDVEIENTDLIVEDQYGQEMTKSDRADLDFLVKSEAEDTFTVDSKNASGKHTITAVDDDASKDSGDVEFTLDIAEDDISASAFTKNFSVVKDEDFDSYSIKDVDDVYVLDEDQAAEEGDAPEKHQKEVEVQAETDAGVKVDLEYDADFSVTSSDVTLDGNKIVGIDKKVESNESYTADVKVTINKTGEEFTKEVTFSSEAPKTNKLEVREGGEDDGENLSDNYKVSGSTVSNSNFTGNIYAEDQYGVEVADDIDGKLKLTFTNIPDDAKVIANGTANAEVTDLEDADSLDVKLTHDDADVNVKVSRDDNNSDEAAEAAENVAEMIGNLPKPDDITLDDKADVEEARDAFEALSDEAKANANLPGLKNREDKIDELTIEGPEDTRVASKESDNGGIHASVDSLGTKSDGIDMKFSDLSSLEITLHDSDDKQLTKAEFNKVGFHLRGNPEGKNALNDEIIKELVAETSAEVYNNLINDDSNELTYADLIVTKVSEDNDNGTFVKGDIIKNPSNGDKTATGITLVTRDSPINGLTAKSQSEWDLSTFSEEDLDEVDYILFKFTTKAGEYYEIKN